MEERNSTVCLEANACQHYNTGHRIDSTSLVGAIDRMENLTFPKIEAIVGVIRAILNEELNRESSYIGLNVFQDPERPNRVNYARSYQEFNFNEYGNIPTIHFIEFENDREAAAYAPVLAGILTLALTRFKIGNRDLAFHGVPMVTHDTQILPPINTVDLFRK
jgi:hypothetical protein